LPNPSSGTSRALLAEALNGLPALSHKLSIRAGIFWMLVTAGLFVCQDSTARILLQANPATEIAFARYFVHMVLVGIFIAVRNPHLARSRRPMLQMLRSSFLLAATLFGMLALKIMPLADFFAVVWVAPVLVSALSA
jgi:drug/metabolite transporter (DMT)-like permease